MTKMHSFHIPVMGIGYSIDSPIKVARYGISSVISLVDDILIEEMRKYYFNWFHTQVRMEDIMSMLKNGMIWQKELGVTIVALLDRMEELKTFQKNWL